MLCEKPMEKGQIPWEKLSWKKRITARMKLWVAGEAQKGIRKIVGKMGPNAKVCPKARLTGQIVQRMVSSPGGRPKTEPPKKRRERSPGGNKVEVKKSPLVYE